MTEQSPREVYFKAKEEFIEAFTAALNEQWKLLIDWMMADTWTTEVEKDEAEQAADGAEL